jgi:hypothetical protein
LAWTVSTEVAISIATGISKNASIKNLKLDVGSGPELDMILSGLGTSSVESLFIHPRTLNVNFRVQISKVLFFVPSLKELCIDDDRQSYRERGLGKIFADLRNPSCVCLTELKLARVSLASDSETCLSNVVPIEEGNSSVQTLDLEQVRFATRRSVCVLWNLVGLRELCIDSPIFSSTASDESDEENWAGFVRRNKDLTQVNVVCQSETAFLDSVLDGAHKHKSLTSLVIERSIFVDATAALGRSAGFRLCRVLQDPTSALRALHFNRTRLDL